MIFDNQYAEYVHTYIYIKKKKNCGSLEEPS